MPAVSSASPWASAHVRRASGARQARKVAFKRSLDAVVIWCAPPLAVVNTCVTASVLPRTIRRATSTTWRCASLLTTCARNSPGGQMCGGRPRVPVCTRALSGPFDRPDVAAQAIHTDQDRRGGRTRPDLRGQRADHLLIAVGPEHATQPEAGRHGHGHRLPHAPHRSGGSGCTLVPVLCPRRLWGDAGLHVDLIRLPMLQVHLPRLHQMRVHPLALRACPPLLIEATVRSSSPKVAPGGLGRTAARQQDEHRRHHCGRRAQPRERRPRRRTKGASTGVTLGAPLLNSSGRGCCPARAVPCARSAHSGRIVSVGPWCLLS